MASSDLVVSSIGRVLDCQPAGEQDIRRRKTKPSVTHYPSWRAPDATPPTSPFEHLSKFAFGEEPTGGQVYTMSAPNLVVSVKSAPNLALGKLPSVEKLSRVDSPSWDFQGQRCLPVSLVKNFTKYLKFWKPRVKHAKIADSLAEGMLCAWVHLHHVWCQHVPNNLYCQFFG